MKNHNSVVMLATLFLAVIVCSSFPVEAVYDIDDERSADVSADVSEVSVEMINNNCNNNCKQLKYANMPEVIKNAPYAYSLLIVNENRKMRILKTIQFMPINDSEKENMSETIKDIWNRVPENISESDYESLQEIGDAIIKYNMMEYAQALCPNQCSCGKCRPEFSAITNYAAVQPNMALQKQKCPADKDAFFRNLIFEKRNKKSFISVNKIHGNEARIQTNRYNSSKRDIFDFCSNGIIYSDRILRCCGLQLSG